MGGRYLVTIWLVYGAASIGLTFFLARLLFRQGSVFLQALFSGNGELARAVSGLLVVGFYMLSLGYSALLLRSEELAKVRNGSDAVGLLVNRLGVLLVSLAVITFVNMWLLYRVGNRGRFALNASHAVSSIGRGPVDGKQDVPA